jgi:transposase InsO family protein
VFEYIEAFYNTRRRHSTIDFHSPVYFETLSAESDTTPGTGTAAGCGLDGLIV